MEHTMKTNSTPMIFSACCEGWPFVCTYDDGGCQRSYLAHADSEIGMDQLQRRVDDAAPTLVVRCSRCGEQVYPKAATLDANEVHAALKVYDALDKMHHEKAECAICDGCTEGPCFDAWCEADDAMSEAIEVRLWKKLRG